jgi:hypothetical protein
MKHDFELVFVHLGNAKASHLWANIKEVKHTSSNVAITLISDQDKNIKRAQKMGIGTFKFILDSELDSAIARLRHNLTFRQGFWNFSILRLFALLKYSEYKPNLPLIHVESDILIMPNFPFENLARLEKPSWMKFNETHDVGSIFTVPSAEYANRLRDKFYELFSEDGTLTDMTLLSKVADKYPELMCYLPVSTSPKDVSMRSDIRDSSEASKLASNIEVFEGIFDSAPLGMWLLGQDPRNHLGRILRFRNLPESFIQAQEIGFEFDRNSKILKTNLQVPIFNLHVHSKELKYFKSKKWKVLSRDVANSKIYRLETSYSLKAFIQLCVDFYIRNGITSIPKKILSLFKV